MTFYSDLAATADALLGDFAQGVIYLIRAYSSNEDAPWDLSESTELIYEFKGTVKGVSNNLIDGTLIKSGDLSVTLTIGKVTPKVGDIIEIDMQRYNVITATQVPAAGTPIVNKLVVRI